MPTTRGYFGNVRLQALPSATAERMTVHVRERATVQAVCDVVFTREELRQWLARMDEIAAVEQTSAEIALVQLDRKIAAPDPQTPTRQEADRAPEASPNVRAG